MSCSYELRTTNTLNEKKEEFSFLRHISHPCGCIILFVFSCIVFYSLKTLTHRIGVALTSVTLSLSSTTFRQDTTPQFSALRLQQPHLLCSIISRSITFYNTHTVALHLPYNLTRYSTRSCAMCCNATIS